MNRPLLVTLCLSALTSCRATESTPREIYVAARDTMNARFGGDVPPDIAERQEERFAKLVQLYQDDRLESAEDFLWASGGLVCSDRYEYLELAKFLALHAAEMGDPRGFTLQAHATDKLLQADGFAQRYGTVIVYQPVLERFELYPVDPLTTDEVRKAMGIPPLAQILAGVDEYNRSLELSQLRVEDLAGHVPAFDPTHSVRQSNEED